MLLKQQFKYLLFALMFIFVILVIRFAVLTEPKDTWICDEGRWVRHGNPTTARPTTPCK